ncbi:tetraspanin 86D isoform X3 [Tachypleus tridentatus]|uniref:tetraspanin 86D isoform X3 n=1 Tax=Tachypleus tridentatus TaxID=6853 RepID=UPI003FD22093
MVGIGGWSFLEEYSESGLPEVKNVFDVLLQVSIVLMVVGAVVFSISFSGCLGALRENTCLLKVFRCCGISDKGYKDWSQNQYFNCSTGNPSSERCAVPYSCCRENADSKTELVNLMCGYGAQDIKSQTVLNEKIYTRGCIEGLMEFVKGNLYLVAGICLGVALVQLFAMYLSRTLLNQITLQRARWT